MLKFGGISETNTYSLFYFVQYEIFSTRIPERLRFNRAINPFQQLISGQIILNNISRVSETKLTGIIEPEKVLVFFKAMHFESLEYFTLLQLKIIQLALFLRSSVYQ